MMRWKKERTGARGCTKFDSTETQTASTLGGIYNSISIYSIRDRGDKRKKKARGMIVLTFLSFLKLYRLLNSVLYLSLSCEADIES